MHATVKLTQAKPLQMQAEHNGIFTKHIHNIKNDGIAKLELALAPNLIHPQLTATDPFRF